MTPEQEQRWKALAPWRTHWSFDGAAPGEWQDNGDRVQQFLDCFGTRFGRVLKLSCLEGAHTYVLAKHVERVVVIEGRRANLLKTALVGEILGAWAELWHEDLETAELSEHGQFDAIFCAGLLYHLRAPWRLLEQCITVSPALFLWTHYSDRNEASTSGRKGHWHAEGGSVTCGLSEQSFWMTRVCLFEELTRVGYTIKVVHEDEGHPQGPAITLACERR